MDHSIYKKMCDVESRHWWFAARRTIIQSVIDSLDLPEDASLLDAGCGTGGNLALLDNYGSVTAIEIDDTAREMAMERHIGTIYPGHLPDGINLPEQQYDLIVLFDVLEHIQDDTGSLAYLRSLLKPGGHILITVPAMQFLWSNHDVIHHHKRRYNQHSLRHVAVDSGLKVNYISYFNTWLFPLIAPFKLLQRFTEVKDDELNIPSHFINVTLKAIFSSERLLIPKAKLPFGISLLAVLGPVD